VRRALGLTLLLTLALPTPANAQEEGEVHVYVLDLSAAQAVGDGSLRSIAMRGGMGLMTETEPTDDVLADLRAIGVPVTTMPNSSHLNRQLIAFGRPDLPQSELLVLAFTRPIQQDGSVATLVMGRGTPLQLMRNEGSPPGLTSATTRRPGVVSNIDLEPTILEFLGRPVPDDVPGSVIRIEGEAPAGLYERYLEYRQVAVPAGLVVLLITLAALAVALVLLFLRGASPSLVRAVAIWGVLGVSLQVALLPGSWLPTYEPWVVALAVGGIGVLVAAAALWWGRGSAVKVPAAVAGIGLGFVVLDGLLGWPSGLTPLLGGSALDGVRFYGLGNSYAGVLLAGSVLVAAILPPIAGLTLLLLSALFAGLPFLGADLGGGVTLFAVAGLWYGLRVRRSAGWAVGAAAAGAVGGAALLLLAHSFLPPERTHVTRAVEESGGLAGIVDVFLDRLRLNLEVTAATPAIWAALAGIPVALWVALTRPGPFRPPLERFEAWRLGVISLAIGGMLGYVLNDTYGMASVSFIYLALALVYPALAVRWTSD
jgi:hypothetical protein